MDTIIIFFNIQLPEGSAAATRAVAWGQLFKAAGYSPVLLGVNYNKEDITEGYYKNIPYYLINFLELQNKGLKSIKRNNILRKKVSAFINELNKKVTIKAIVLGNPEYEVKWLLKEKRLTGIPVIPDVVEWYDFSRFIGPFAIYKFLKNRITLRYWNVQCRNLICISTLLEKYYKGRKCNVIRIPTILNTQDFLADLNARDSSERIVIAYAGSPAKKDLILNMAKAIACLSKEERRKVQLNIYGTDLEGFRRLGLDEKILNSLGESLKCFGRVSHSEVKRQLAVADYTVLLRPNKKYANAGFPTKVGESMAMGVPVIANITSDLGKYLHDGIEGIICDDESPEACAKAIRKALSIDESQRKMMRKNARRQAEESFDYRNYIKPVQMYIEGIIR